jgi:hypothetical protein
LIQFRRVPPAFEGSLGVSPNTGQIFVPFRIPFIPLVGLVIGTEIIPARIITQQLKRFAFAQNETAWLTLDLEISLKNDQPP